MNWFGKQGMVFFRGGIPILKWRRCSSSRLRIEIADFGLTQGVLDRKPLSLSIACHLGLWVEKYPQEANAVMLCWSIASFMVQIKPKPRPDWSLLGVKSNSRGGSRGRVQGVRTPPPEMTCGFLIQLVFYQKKNYMVYWCWSRARNECTPS